MSFRDLTVREQEALDGIAELRSELKAAEADRDYFAAILQDIAQGNVSKHDPTGLRAIQTESKEHFQERLNAWMQTLARAALFARDAWKS